MTRGPVEVVTLGECLVSLVATARGPLAEASTFERTVAGAEANVAVGLARLGRRAALVGRVGDDGFGTAIRRRLAGEGVDVAGLSTDPAAPTGVMVRELRVLGPPEVLYLRRGSAGSRLSPDDVRAAADRFAEARWLHLTGITPALSATARDAVATAIELARTHGLSISLDLNLRRRLWTEAEAEAVLRDLAARSDVVLGSLDEAALVADLGADASPAAVAAGVRALGVRTVVLKLGASGALALDGDGPPVARPAFPVPSALDPVGAGDAFSAAWIAARIEGRGPAETLERANAAGASAVATIGDLTGLPTRAELDRLVAAGGPDMLR